MPTGEAFLPVENTTRYDPIRNVGRLLIDASAQLTQAVDHRARELGVTGAQWAVLIRIGGGIGNTATELCRTLGYDSGAMTRLLDRLVKLGLVTRAPSPEDGRSSQISLTSAGEQLYPRLIPIAMDVLSDHLQGFSPSETHQFMAFLERIVANGEQSVRPGTDAAVLCGHPVE